MQPHLRQTIEELATKLRALEAELVDTKKTINALCKLGGEAPMYEIAGDSEQTPAISAIKGDTFYGQAFATAATTYMRMRRAQNLGPATVADIHAALKSGGFVFEASSDDYARRGVRHSLSKNTQTFHRLPNGEFGLAEWYPAAKKVKAAKTSPSANGADVESGNEDEDEDDVWGRAPDPADDFGGGNAPEIDPPSTAPATAAPPSQGGKPTKDQPGKVKDRGQPT